MAVNKRTQKQIAERFEGNRDYYDRPHYWRRLRFWITWLVTLGGIAALIWYARETRQTGQFFSPGPLTQPHLRLEADCTSCHTKGDLAPKEAFAANTLTLIDKECQTCHESRGFVALHQPNAAGDTSCSSCHKEHVGPGPMPQTTDLNCAACHANKTLMETASNLGIAMAPNTFPNFKKAGTLYFPKTRPANGYTKVFKSFWEGHPQFYFKSPDVKDPNPLRYGHAIHLRSPRIPQFEGSELDCESCHQPDRNGASFLPVKYETSCKSCHALVIDPEFPKLNIPHKDPGIVRSFIRAAGSRYSDYAVQNMGMSRPDADAFGLKKQQELLGRLNKQGITNLDNYEKYVFFGNGKDRPEDPSCAYCHTVTQGSGDPVPKIAQTRQWDEYFQHAAFDHSKHRLVKCIECHDAEQSTSTADVMMPSVKECAQCHSPRGTTAKSGAPFDCSYCHQYHAPTKQQKTAGGGTTLRKFVQSK